MPIIRQYTMTETILKQRITKLQKRRDSHIRKGGYSKPPEKLLCTCGCLCEIKVGDKVKTKPRRSTASIYLLECWKRVFGD